MLQARTSHFLISYGHECRDPRSAFVVPGPVEPGVVQLPALGLDLVLKVTRHSELDSSRDELARARLGSWDCGHRRPDGAVNDPFPIPPLSHRVDVRLVEKRAGVNSAVKQYVGRRMVTFGSGRIEPVRP
jgi:hypothetical protein